MKISSFFPVLFVCFSCTAAFSESAKAAITSGEVDFFNGDTSDVNVTSTSLTNGFTADSDPVTPVNSRTTETVVHFTGPIKTTADYQFTVESTRSPGYGCKFESRLSYMYSMNGLDYYYTNNYAIPYGPSGATSYPTCTAEASGPTMPIANLNAYFSITDIP